jgi:uncharacterized protein YqjF (DUF2071 family)
MTLMLADIDTTATTSRTTLHRHALQRMIDVEGGGWFRSDWLRAVFIHLEVDPIALQRHVPFEVDLFHGRAFVSLVAFSMRRFRPRGTGAAGAVLCALAARHGLLNVRTYVRHKGEPGILFLTEWIANPLSVVLGPLTYGLPYRRAALCYAHDFEHGRVEGSVVAHDGAAKLSYEGRVGSSGPLAPVNRESLDEFLLERYTAFTVSAPGGKPRLFRVWHRPWMQAALDVQIKDRSLLRRTGPYLDDGEVSGGHVSPGVTDVWIGRPRVTVAALPEP